MLYTPLLAGKNGRKKGHTPADGRDNVTSIGDITPQRAAATTNARSARHTTARTHVYREGRQRWLDNRYDDASNYYERNDYGDEDENRDNEWDPESDVN